MINWCWERTKDRNLLHEILSIVEIKPTELNAILRCVEETDVYNAYIAYNSESKKIEAIAIATWLPKFNTLHIEDFALHPRIRKAGHSVTLWNSWVHFISESEKWICDANVSMTIEVYIHNVVAWRKIMGVEPLLLYKTKLWWETEEILWMGKNLKYPATAIILEWIDIQQKEKIRQQATTIKSKL
jgi:hypothetical protein